VYCHDMAGTPREYLTLPRTGGSYNYSQYGQGPNTASGGLRTTFSKVRFQPQTLTIDLSDITFSQSTGWKRFASTYVYSNGYGLAGDCVSAWSSSGTANIDLTGTPFAIVPNQFKVDGSQPAGSTTPNGYQVVNVTGGGYCGANSVPSGFLQLTWMSASCAELRALDPSAPDGDYSLDLGGGRHVDVYCHDMAGTPREYLSLPRTGGSYNTAYYGQGPNTSVGGLTTAFTRVRLDVQALKIDMNDLTFSQSTGWKQFASTYVYSNSYGLAADCAGAYSQKGWANVDLTGTPFAIIPNQFQLNGYLPAGSATPSGPQVLNLTGGGYCGAISVPGGFLRLSYL
jgi:GON domain-containing protein